MEGKADMKQVIHRSLSKGVRLNLPAYTFVNIIKEDLRIIKDKIADLKMSLT